MEDVFVDFTVSVLMLNKLVQKIKSFEIEKFGLKPVHVMCIYYLDKNPRGLTAKELVDLTLEDKAAISRALKIMQTKGFVKYDFNSRNSVAVLTDAGREVAQTVGTRVEKAVEAGTLDFTEEQRIFFYKSLEEIVAKLKTYHKDLVKNNG